MPSLPRQILIEPRVEHHALTQPADTLHQRLNARIEPHHLGIELGFLGRHGGEAERGESQRSSEGESRLENLAAMGGHELCLREEEEKLPSF